MSTRGSRDSSGIRWVSVVAMPRRQEVYFVVGGSRFLGKSITNFLFVFI